MPAVRTSSSPKRSTNGQDRPNAGRKSRKPYHVMIGKDCGWSRQVQYDNEYAPTYVVPRTTSLVVPQDERPPPLTLHDLECVKTLGVGSYGRVLLVRTTRRTHPFDQPGSLFALKAIKRKELRNLAHKEHFRQTQRERFNMQCLPFNTFVAGLVQTFEDSRNLYMMLEFIPCGDLRSIMHKFKYVKPHMASFYFANIACGLRFLHTNDIIHGDIKPDNILVGPDGYLALTDFGSTSHMGWEERDGWDYRSTVLYQAPECAFPHLFKDIYDGAVDWWSVGIILFEMTVVKVPFWRGDSEPTQRNIMHMEYEWPSHIQVGDNLKDLISQLLRKNAVERLGNNIREVYNHPWLENINWDKIEQKQYFAPYIPETTPLAEQWHHWPLPRQRAIPDVAIVEPPLYLMNDNRYPPNPHC
ncbi:kinase-like domain-containing protein [Cyathus striatus]|nr:kinase-like domain-containing protein [Cyathus striatus]